jgi:transmembrane sensor
MNKERIWTLMARKLTGEATNAELNELNLLIQTDKETYLSLCEKMQAYWHIPVEKDEDFLEATYLLHLDKLKKLGHNIENSSTIDKTAFDNFLHLNAAQKRKRKTFVAFAASFIVVMIIGLFYYTNSTKKANDLKLEQSIVSTKKGSRTKLELPDGTTVWLNSNSELLYNAVNYGKTIREVTLTGEGYFDVIKNPSKPFIIHTKRLDIKVLGTSFNVKSYPSEKTTETSLIKGSIEVNLKEGNEKIMMKPNDKLVVSDNMITQNVATKKNLVTPTNAPLVILSRLNRLEQDSSIVETAWLENRLVFNNESFEEIAQKMERWYNLTITITDINLKAKKFTGIFEKETATQALKAMQYTTEFKYSIKNNQVTIFK